MIDETLIEQLKGHLNEADSRNVKVAKLEENMKNIVRSLAKGDTEFKAIGTKIELIHKGIVTLTHTIHGNGTPGMAQLVQTQAKLLTEITTNCKVHEPKIDKIEDHEKILQQQIGVWKLFKFVGIAVLIFVVLAIGKSIILFFIELAKL